jgi:hypothetical protein
MMSQKGVGESVYGQTGSTYGGYEGDQAYARQRYETSYEQSPREGSEGKVYARPRDHKNMLRFGLATMALVTLITCAVFCMISGGGPEAWIGFGIASFAIFLIVTVAIDKIK